MIRVRYAALAVRLALVSATVLLNSNAVTAKPSPCISTMREIASGWSKMPAEMQLGRAYHLQIGNTVVGESEAIYLAGLATRSMKPKLKSINNGAKTPSPLRVDISEAPIPGWRDMPASVDPGRNGGRVLYLGYKDHIKTQDGKTIIRLAAAVGLPDHLFEFHSQLFDDMTAEQRQMGRYHIVVQGRNTIYEIYFYGADSYSLEARVGDFDSMKASLKLRGIRETVTHNVGWIFP